MAEQHVEDMYGWGAIHHYTDMLERACHAAIARDLGKLFEEHPDLIEVRATLEHYDEPNEGCHRNRLVGRQFRVSGPEGDVLYDIYTDDEIEIVEGDLPEALAETAQGVGEEIAELLEALLWLPNPREQDFVYPRNHEGRPEGLAREKARL